MVKSENLPFISIVVVLWNSEDLIDGLYHAIDKQTYPHNRLELLLVDNNSQDETTKRAEDQRPKYARLIKTGGNYGYAGGNNFGFRETKGEFIVVCNPDIRPDPNWLMKLVETAVATKADVVVPKVVFSDKSLINNAGSDLHPMSDWPIIDRGINESAHNSAFDKRVEVTAFCGASPLLRRSFLNDIGVFDKYFFLYWEDGDLSWRGQKAHKHYIYEPGAVAAHYHGGSTGGEQSKTFIYYVSRNRVLILIKHAQLHVAVKAFIKVCRDHIIWKVRDLWEATLKGSGKRQAAGSLLLGIKIVLGVIRLTPIMLAKRWHILREEAL